MDRFETTRVPQPYDAIAPDGSEIRFLTKVGRGSMVHCRLPPGATTKAVGHHRVDEIWYVVGGRGEVWRRLAEQVEVVEVEPGVALSIPVGTHFQFRAPGPEELSLVIVTMPPWPGDEEAYEVEGRWIPNGLQADGLEGER